MHGAPQELLTRTRTFTGAPVDIRFSSEPPEAVVCDLLAVAVRKDEDFARLDRCFDGKLTELARSRQFTGADGSALSVPTFGRLAAAELVLLGVGDGTRKQLRAAATRAGRLARSCRGRTIALDIPLDAPALVEAIAAGNYTYDKFKRETDRAPALESLTLLGRSAEPVSNAQARASAQAFARDLVNAPAAELYPETLCDAARSLASLPNVSVEVWDEARLEAEGCVGILAVGAGSARGPRMACIRYRPPGAKAHIALVGKGVTFDSGGLSLKPGGAMQTMRCDMAGAATVLGVARAVAEQGVPVAVDTFIGCVENMTGGHAYKLGDILTYKNGVTVEIHNTDAEGRLVLADCLIRACEVGGVTHVVDLATLTGACVVAIGSDFTGLFTDDDALATALSAASDANDEGMWRLPLHAPYKEMLKADWAQLKNVGGRDAGATTAALFLQHFVDGKTWAHLDIAGSAFLEKGNSRYAAGATGEMVRSLSTWIEGLGV